MTDTVLSFLEQRLAEKEAVARAATTAWEPTSGEWTAVGHEIRSGYDNTMMVKWSWPKELAHIALNDPAQVLREVAAVRAVLGLHGPSKYGTCPTCSDPGIRAAGDSGNAEWPCVTIRCLASAWVNHPDFPGWHVKGPT